MQVVWIKKKSYVLENECLLMKESILMASMELLANDFCIMPESEQRQTNLANK